MLRGAFIYIYIWGQLLVGSMIEIKYLREYVLSKLQNPRFSTTFALPLVQISQSRLFIELSNVVPETICKQMV